MFNISSKIFLKNRAHHPPQAAKNTQRVRLGYITVRVLAIRMARRNYQPSTVRYTHLCSMTLEQPPGRPSGVLADHLVRRHSMAPYFFSRVSHFPHIVLRLPHHSNSEIPGPTPVPLPSKGTLRKYLLRSFSKYLEIRRSTYRSSGAQSNLDVHHWGPSQNSIQKVSAQNPTR